ncbi:hypothetical protein MY04_4705 [Flammeovirga sp. MY04]|uniref:hypothetical protein n=1 Tax=Flammeovirga sp. MY04 TaxID=1191459 RepID=UPI00080626C9|nr:hypothetical protein [Flammeovirga sp. MY04]ANQ52040.1 hypothetical protein MY04_4705 [Flammeovirga sp. MY04]
MNQLLFLLLFLVSTIVYAGQTNTKQLTEYDDYRIWSNVSGTTMFKAKYLAESENSVFLEKIDGSIHKIPLTTFHSNDQSFIVDQKVRAEQIKNKMYSNMVQSKWLIIFAIVLLLISMVFMYHSHKYALFLKFIFGFSIVILFVGSTSSYVRNFDMIFNYYTNISNKSDLQKDLESIFEKKIPTKLKRPVIELEKKSDLFPLYHSIILTTYSKNN